MARPATPAKKRGRGPIRLIVVLVVLVVLIGGLLVGLNVGASAATSVGATVTAYVPDARDRAQLRFPDGTAMPLPSSSEITLTAPHFAKDGHVHGISIQEKVGRT